MIVQVATVSIPFVAGVDKPHTYKVIDWNNRSDRQWLTNHQHWAMCNNHAVTIHPVSS